MNTTSSAQEFFRDDPWELIKSPCYPDGRRLYLHDERFWVSMDESRNILFFVQDRGAQSIKPLENLAGLEVSIETCRNGDQRLVCRLTVQEPEFIEKFGIVAKVIAFHCSAYQGPQLFLKTQERIRSWANFLRPSRSGLTHSEFVGFLGELYLLSEHLLTTLPAGDVVRAWIGPEGKKQDFTFEDIAIEVKTTLVGDQQTMSISSLDQLDRITDKLYLIRVVASPSRGPSGLSLGGMYERCLREIDHDVVAEGLFLQKASKFYGKASESQINDQYLITGVIIFDVNDQFPRLTRGSIDLAIRDVEYELSVGALKNFELSIAIEDIVRHG